MVSEGGCPPPREPRARNYDEVADLVAEQVAKTVGKISAKRLLPAARAAGYGGSDRNFRRLVADTKGAWRQGRARAGGRRPADPSLSADERAAGPRGWASSGGVVAW